MLVLSRKLGEKIFAEYDEATLRHLLDVVKQTGKPVLFEITVVDIDRGKIRLGIEAHRQVPIYRPEHVSGSSRNPASGAPDTQGVTT